MQPTLRATATAFVLGALGPATAAGQAVLDWPLLIEARPVSLVGGAAATLGNPAGLADLGRAEGLVSDLQTPDALGLQALSIAGGVRLFDRVSIGAGYRHVGVGDMQRTDGPPLGSPGSHGSTPSLEVAEDVYALAAALRLRDLAVGAAVRLDTPAEELSGEESWAGAIGAAFAPRIPVVELRLAGSLGFERDDQRVAAAIEVGAPPLLRRRLALALAWGAERRGAFSGSDWRESPLGSTQRLVLSGRWSDVAELQLGASAQPGAGVDDEWVPLVAGLIHLGRYDLGIVREHLPNGFGAAMHYRLGVAF